MHIPPRGTPRTTKFLVMVEVCVLKKSSVVVADDGELGKLRVSVQYLALSHLSHPENETRIHSKSQLRKLARSIAEHGFIVPVTIYGDGVIASGNARVRASKLAGLTEVPVIRLEHLSEAQARLFAIADNKLLEGGEWDSGALRVEFAAIAIASPTIDLGRSGFTIGERDVIVGRHRTNELADLDDHVGDEKEPPVVTRMGDVFLLGPHRIVCGDARDAVALRSATAGHTVRTLVSDLPYNVKIAGNVSGHGERTHDEFAMASGEMSKDEFIRFLQTAISAAQSHLIGGGLAYLFMDWRHLDELSAAARACELKQLNLLVWEKTNAGMGLFYRSAHELICLYKHGQDRHTNTVALGAYGRNRTNVLHYPGVNTFTKGRNAALKLHPTVKPVALIADLILDSSAPNELILDSFGGSGTTLIAAHSVDRIAALIEYEPKYVDVTVRRFEKLSGIEAIHEQSGKTYSELRSDRCQLEIA